jgi:hypothetical protein
MTTILRAAAKSFSRLIFHLPAILFVGFFPLAAQTTSSTNTDTPAVLPASSAPSGVRAVLNLDDGWRFQQGDDPRWADPAFDDKDWTSLTLSTPIVQQGIVFYTGYGWYRLRLQPQQLAVLGNPAAHAPLLLLVTSNTVGQFSVYVNGVESGHTRGMTEAPSEYQSPSFVVPLPDDRTQPVTLAIRSWAGPATSIRRGLLERVEVGTPGEITDKLSMAAGRQWNEHANAAILVAFLYLCVAVLGAALYLAQRHHSEYLWMALLCIPVAAGGASDAIFGLGRMPHAVYQLFMLFTERVFMAVTVEFVLRFTASRAGRAVRIFQASVLLLPFLYILHLIQIYDVLTVVAEVAFCALVTLLLYRAWRRGRGEAGIMLVPFFLATTADSLGSLLDYAASKNWLAERFASHRLHFGPIEFGTGTICYTVFLGSLVAVILYRFIRVSQEEQRTTAEIAAARSVQALLIPTQLPSNKNFMLESAYLPVHGVGGDFFQVLPVKDDSLLIVVGDVSGKGLQAAMNSSTLVGALRNEISHDPATVLAHLNHVLIGAVSAPGAVPDLDCAPCYATCLCARIYPDGTTSIANAGHLNPYRDGRELQLVPSLPLGVIANTEYEQITFRLNRGDRLVFLSDGVVEATNEEGELFGFERTQQVSHEPARYIAQTAQRFGQTDDITVLSLYVASRAAERNSEGAVYST